jgi:hypothetical protein
MPKGGKFEASAFESPEIEIHLQTKTKHYELIVKGSQLASRWGKIDSNLQSIVKGFADHDITMMECSKLLKSKTEADDPYQIIKDCGSKHVSDLPTIEKKAKATKEAGAKRSTRGSEKADEPESKVDVPESKKAKLDITDTAGTKSTDEEPTTAPKTDTAANVIMKDAPAAAMSKEQNVEMKVPEQSEEKAIPIQ